MSVSNSNELFHISPALYLTKLNESFTGAFNPLDYNISFLSNHLKELLDFFSYPKTLNEYQASNQSIDEVEVHTDLQFLIDKKLIISTQFNLAENFLKKGLELTSKKPRLKVAYIILNELCNMNCRYCFVKGATHNSHKPKIMDEVIANKTVSFIKNHATIDNEPLSIIFYGGEPLTNFTILKYITDRLNQIEKQGDFGHLGMKKSIVTNGTLINSEIADFLAKNNIYTSVSIDGYQELHDLVRVYHNSRKTFNKVIEGYMMLKAAGVETGISCTLGSHNIEQINDVTEFFIKELKPSSIGFNMMRTWKFSKNYYTVAVDKLSEGLIKAFVLLRAEGIYEDRIMRILNSVINKKIRPYECSGCGDQLCFFPNGDYTPCHAFYPSSKYIIGNVTQSGVNIDSEPTLCNWRKRTPLLYKQCQNCSFITICGGGCAYETETQTGSIHSVDENYCEHVRIVMDWLIKDIFSRRNVSP